LVRLAGGLHDYQDCNSDPRDGCEDTNRWCQLGLAENNGPRKTQNDKCSKAALYYCSGLGFDVQDAPCSDPANGLFLDFPAPSRSAMDCWDLYTKNNTYKTNTTNFAPYCDRDASHLDTRGDCVFECQTNYANCDQLATNGCEADIRTDTTCDTLCVDCIALSGIDRTIVPKCVPDPSRVGNHYRCNFTCPGAPSAIINCDDADRRWENGCEVATNSDIDYAGVFMNEGDSMDCSVMQIEARKNPELFRHHLHIDLTKAVPTTLGRKLPPGTIFCDNNLADPTLSGGTPGKCFFMCIDGFDNTDRVSANGCEGIKTPYYIDSAVTNDLIFGGYWIGDPHVEAYLDFLCTASLLPAYSNFITFPANVCDFNSRTNTGAYARASLGAGATAVLKSPLWY